VVLRGVTPLVRGRRGDDDIKCPNVEWTATRKMIPAFHRSISRDEVNHEDLELQDVQIDLITL
jgi:hypothetical protein